MEKFLFACLLLACLCACLYPLDFARELEVKCSRGQVRITADSKSRSHRFDTAYREMTCFFFLFFFCNVHACASAASAIKCSILYEAGYGDAVLQRLSKR